MSSPLIAELHFPDRVCTLLERLHSLSEAQEANYDANTFTPSRRSDTAPKEKQAFDQLMLDKFIALDRDKCQFVYQLIRATGALNVLEAGTSFGVSTIYLAMGVLHNLAGTSHQGKVIGTEKESTKAAIAKEHWREAGQDIQDAIELREGDLLQSLASNLPTIDFVLLDIWCPLALPALKLAQPKLSRGAIVIADNIVSSAEGYRDLLQYLREPSNGFTTTTVPYTNGLLMAVCGRQT